MSKEERYAEHTVAWELPNGDSVTKSNYNLAGIETKYTPIQTEVISDDKDKRIADLEAKLADMERCAENNKKVAELVSAEHNAKIENLEKQLAESEDKNKKLKDEVCKSNVGIAHLKNQLKQAKEQLAEKEFAHNSYFEKAESTISFLQQQFNKKGKIEEQLDELKHQLAQKECIIAEIKNDIKEMREFKVGDDEYDLTDSDARFSLECELLNKDQDKISFCIEKLEKVKEACEEIPQCDEYGDDWVLQSGLFEYIDNEIEELKKEMK